MAEEARADLRKRSSGLWVVWLVVPLVGVLILAVVLLQAGVVNSVASSSREAEVMATSTLVAGTIPGALDSYRATRRQYPESLDALVELKRLRKNQLVDAWNKPLIYEVNGDEFRLCSGGPDKVPGNADDICNNTEE